MSDRPQPTGDQVPADARVPVSGLGHLPAIDVRLLDVLRPGAHAVMRRYWRIEEFGRDRLPEGPSVLAINHLSNVDGPVVVGALPGTLALAKRELFHGGLGWLLDHVGQIPVDRQWSDPWAVCRCLQVLESGRRLAIFPESHRGAGDFSVFRPGAAYLAMVTGAPVVPVALLGTRPANGTVKSLPPRGARICIVYGDPVPVAQVPWPRRPDAVAAEARRLQEVCRRHVVRAQQLTGMALPPWPTKS